MVLNTKTNVMAKICGYITCALKAVHRLIAAPSVAKPVENSVTVKQLLAVGARLIIEPPLRLSDLPVNKTLVYVQDDSVNIHVNPCETEEDLEAWANNDNFKLWFLLETVVADKLFEAQSVN